MRHLCRFLCLTFLLGGSLMGLTTPIYSSLLGALTGLGILVFHSPELEGGGQGSFLTQVVTPRCPHSSRRRRWLSMRPG